MFWSENNENEQKKQKYHKTNANHILHEKVLKKGTRWKLLPCFNQKKKAHRDQSSELKHKKILEEEDKKT